MRKTVHINQTASHEVAQTFDDECQDQVNMSWGRDGFTYLNRYIRQSLARESIEAPDLGDDRPETYIEKMAVDRDSSGTALNAAHLAQFIDANSNSRCEKADLSGTTDTFLLSNPRSASVATGIAPRRAWSVDIDWRDKGASLAGGSAALIFTTLVVGLLIVTDQEALLANDAVQIGIGCMAGVIHKAVYKWTYDGSAANITDLVKGCLVTVAGKVTSKGFGLAIKRVGVKFENDVLEGHKNLIKNLIKRTGADAVLTTIGEDMGTAIKTGAAGAWGV
ncbi:hypothetical protein [Nocardioides rubriscoriae]|uniref:hypothetical protein n=1 Tax=Nocardioides rubriscoriae TaxID=642762 RepID=UPI0011DF569C|nr:hypothetical protein [Nocardioides rubriscoriae]